MRRKHRQTLTAALCGAFAALCFLLPHPILPTLLLALVGTINLAWILEDAQPRQQKIGGWMQWR